ncbi:MAG: sensor domain-containing diguanylate cyclase [Thermodesulfobacteriota bacterium]
MDDHNLLSREQLLGCVDFGKALTSELNPNRLLKKILDMISEIFPSENWSLFILDEETSELRFELSVNLDTEKIKDVRIALGEGVAGHCAQEQKLVVCEDASDSELFTNRIDEMTGSLTKALICIPLIYGGRTLGVLEIVNPKTIDKAGIALLSLLSDYLAIGVENARRYKKMHEMSIRDGLTGLYNQRYLYCSLDELVAMDRVFSLIFLDIDEFKAVVDSVGHLYGSRVIEEVARTINSCLDDESFGVAYGGDEFVVVLPDIAKKEAVEVARKIRDHIKSTVFLSCWGCSVRITASFGVASFPEDTRDYTELLSLADKSLFNVKHTGKGRVEWTPDCPRI